MFRDKVASEIESSQLDVFAVAVDVEHKQEMTSRVSDFLFTRGDLVSDHVIARFYAHLQKKIPTCHMMFTSIVPTDSFQVPHTLDGESPENKCEKLHWKQSMILYLFLGLLRPRNRLYLKNFTMVKPIAH